MPDDAVDHHMFEWLQTRSEPMLTTILTNRPDVLGIPWPRTLTGLARRLSTYESTSVALRTIALPSQQVLDALQAAAATNEPERVPLARVVELLDGSSPEIVRNIIRNTLEPTALAWLVDEQTACLSERFRSAELQGLKLGRPLPQVLSESKVDELKQICSAVGAGASGRKVELIERLTVKLADPETIARLLNSAPSTTRELLQDLAWNGPNAAGYYDSYFPCTARPTFAIARPMGRRAISPSRSPGCRPTSSRCGAGIRRPTAILRSIGSRHPRRNAYRRLS